jgi:hypothetical protein
MFSSLTYIHSTCCTGTCTKEVCYCVREVDQVVIYCSNSLQGWRSKAGAALVKDQADAVGHSIKLLLKNSDFHSELLGWSSQSDDKVLRETAPWVQGVISRVVVSWGKAAPVKLMALSLVICPISAIVDGSWGNYFCLVKCIYVVLCC